MSQEGDIVFMIGGDTTGLTRAGQSGEQSLVAMEKAAKALEREIGKIGQAGVDFQREMNKLTGVTTEFSKSARESAAAFEAFERARAQVDNLRASIDPLFAASKRYETALLQLDAALEMGTISAREHAQMADMVAASYLRADSAAGQMGTGVGLMGRMAQNARGQIQNVGYQVQDFAVQLGAGTSATQAFAQQFPQMASAFGPWGVAIGTAAAILVPLGAAFLSAADNADTMTEALDRQKTIAEELVAVSERLRLERAMIDTGAQTEAEQRAMEEMKRLAAERYALEYELSQLLNSANDTMGMINQKEVDRVKAAIQTNEANRVTNQQLLDRIARERAHLEATKLTQAAAEEFQKLMQQIAAADISSPWQKAVSWIQRAIDKQGELARASGVYGEIGARGDPRQFGANSGMSNTFGVENFRDPEAFGSGVGGGGGGANPIQTQLESLRQQMMTEEQIEMESFARRQEMLQQALDQKLVTQQEYASLMEQAQEKHQAAMSDIDVMRYGTAAQQFGEYMSGISSILQAGGEKQQRIAKAFAAAETLINAWRAYGQTLSDPSLPFFAKLPAAMKILAAGMGAVNAIRSGSKSAAGTGASAAAAGVATSGAVAPQAVQTLNFTINNDQLGFGERIARQLAQQINEASRNGVALRASVQ